MKCNFIDSIENTNAEYFETYMFELVETSDVIGEFDDAVVTGRQRSKVSQLEESFRKLRYPIVVQVDPEQKYFHCLSCLVEIHFKRN